MLTLFLPSHLNFRGNSHNHICKTQKLGSLFPMMTMHTKSDSDDLTSLAPSSSQLAYYVQSPSHDGSKSSSMHATPAFHCPSESPSYSYARHSRESSASRVSGAFRWAVGGLRRSYSPHCPVIDEEADHYYSNRCRVLFFLFCVSLAFTVSCFIAWGAAKPFKTDIDVLSLTMHHFHLGQGSDLTGVPTKLATVNCSVKMTVHNPLYGAGASMATTMDKSGHVRMRLVFALKTQGDVVGKLVRSTHKREISCSVLIDRHNQKPVKLKQGSCTYT